MLAQRSHQTGSLWPFLLSVDKDLAECARRNGCPSGGRLHYADYPRAPRSGLGDLPNAYRYRFSFCRDRDGCRKRVTPPSVRFLGRKVFLVSSSSWSPRCGRGQHRAASAAFDQK